MNLKRIKTLMMVIDHRNFSNVAQILNISQPAVSKQIKTLETELGVNLLYRDTLEPTEAGRLVYHRGKSFLLSWDELIQECRSFQGEMTGLLKIGASTIPGTYLVPSFLRTFLDSHPRMEVHLTVHESDEVIEQVEEGKLDIGFVGSEPKEESVVSQIISTDHLVLIGPPESDVVDGFGDIKMLPFIFRGDRSGTWQAVQAGLKNWGGSIEELTCVAKVHNTESVISMVEAGLGYSIISDIAAQPATIHGRIKVLATLPIERSFHAIYLEARKKHPAVQALIHLASAD